MVSAVTIRWSLKAYRTVLPLLYSIPASGEASQYSTRFVILPITTRTTSHKYDNDEDPDCNVCKTTREIPTAFEKWWDANNQWIGYVVAGIVFVGGALGVYFWIPKNKDVKKKSK